ncbi:MAG: NAD-dependent epimerase/dehydratase family protein [Proteobacteria bacterium]|nr:NAD-dependent epimerase/dehydratase family protein [Pseudomonadota bacterium]
MSEIFITGVTGFVGRHLAVRLLNRPDVGQLWCLVRATDIAHGRERLLKSLKRATDDEHAEALIGRIQPVLGDLTKERLGLSADQSNDVIQHCTVFLHAAADVRFNQDLEDARLRNVFGTQQVVAFAREVFEAGRLDRLDWVGTAFVAGNRPGPVSEDELEHDAGWRNSYEQSKYEAESWLREHCGDMPLTVFRPSIIVGESNTGATSNFGMMYWPVQIYARGWWRTIVGSPKTMVDLVPVNYVADSIELLSRADQPTGRTWQLAAGEGGARTIEELAALCHRYFGGKPARYIDPGFFMKWVRPVVNLFLWGKKARVLKQGGEFFVPYFTAQPKFDTAKTRQALADSGIAAPTVEDYFSTLLDYAVQTDFGKRSVSVPGSPPPSATTAA